MLQRLDATILRFVQKWIADPLQFSGICLDWQVRAAVAIGVLADIWACYLFVTEKSWAVLGIVGLSVMIELGWVIYGMSPGIKLLFAQKISRYFWLGLCLAGWLLMALSSLIGAGIEPDRFPVRFFEVAFVAVSYLLVCEPKPPVGNHKFAFDGAQ